MVDNHIDRPCLISITHNRHRYSYRYPTDVRSPISIVHIDLPYRHRIISCHSACNYYTETPTFQLNMSEGMREPFLSLLVVVVDEGACLSRPPFSSTLGRFCHFSHSLTNSLTHSLTAYVRIPQQVCTVSLSRKVDACHAPARRTLLDDHVAPCRLAGAYTRLLFSST